MPRKKERGAERERTGEGSKINSKETTMPRHSSSSAVGQRVRSGGRCVCVWAEGGGRKCQVRRRGNGEGGHWESGGEGAKLKSEETTITMDRHSSSPAVGQRVGCGGRGVCMGRGRRKDVPRKKERGTERNR